MKEDKIHVSIIIPGIDIPLELDFTKEVWGHIKNFSIEKNISTEEAITMALYEELCDDISDVDYEVIDEK